MEDRTTSYGETQGIRLLRELANEGHFVFSITDAREVANQIGISATYLRTLLTQLIRSGWLIRLRQGVYAGMGSLPGDVQIHPFVVATQIVQPAAISHWSAMHHHGFTQQVPQVVTAITPKKIVTPSMRKSSDSSRQTHHAWEIGGVRYEYINVKSEHYFGIEEVWIDQNFRIPITDRERTLLDMFANPRLFGGMGETLTVLEEHAHEIDVCKLVNYALRYGKGSAAKRLGWSLERVGITEEVTSPLASIPTNGFRILDPTRPHYGPCDKRWGIQNNLESEARC